jgi:cyclase
MVGNACTAVEFFNSWSVDEIIVLEISDNSSQISNFVEIIGELSQRCFVPLSVGGKIRNIETAHVYLRTGADKVVLNTGALETPNLIQEIASRYGSQCVVVSIDGAPDPSKPSGYTVMVDNGRRDSGYDFLEWVRDAIKRGAGELLINSVDHDGDKRGYDLTLTSIVSEAVKVPVVAMGGVGKWSHLIDGIVKGGAHGVAAGNIFHYTEHSTKKAKEFLSKAGVSVRRTNFYKLQTPRRVRYQPFQGRSE